MNTLQQKSKIAKEIFDKIAELRDYSCKLENAKTEHEKIKQLSSEEQERYDFLNKGFSDFSEDIEKKKNDISSIIDFLKQERNKIENQIVELKKDFKVLSSNIEKETKLLLDKIDKNCKEKEKTEKELAYTLEEKRKEDLVLNNKKEETKNQEKKNKELRKEYDKTYNELIEMKEHIKLIAQREIDVSIREQRICLSKH